MGTVISKAFNGVGGALGTAFVAPLKTIFGRSCEGSMCKPTFYGEFLREKYAFFPRFPNTFPANKHVTRPSWVVIERKSLLEKSSST